MKSFDTEPLIEMGSSAKPKAQKRSITLRDAIDLGEYDPEYLATFAEWHTLTPHIQFQYIREALDIRRKQYLLQWAEINNMLDFHLKPHLAEALKNIEKQLKVLEKDREAIYLQYSRSL